MISWEVRKRDGIFGLWIRDYPAQGLPVEWTLFKPIDFEMGRFLIESNLAHGELKDIDRWEKDQ
jgi:hypothetical protein